MDADTEHPLIMLKFNGPTFAGDALPASALREIALFQEAFVRVAEEIWRSGNPVWPGLPPGFAEAVEPRMRSLRAGEAELGCCPALNGRDEPDGAAGAFAAAGDLILAGLMKGTDGHLHSDLSLATLDKLSGFGASLGADDSITVQWGARPPVQVDRWGRNALRRAALAACEAAAGAPRATVGDLLKLADRTFGQVPDEVWAELPVLGPEDTDDYLRPRR